MAALTDIIAIFKPFVLTSGAPPHPLPTYGLTTSSSRMNPSTTQTVVFLGTNTAWTTSAPTFAATGAPVLDGSWSQSAVAVVDDFTATQVITTGVTRGTVTFTDSTTEASCQFTVAPRSITDRWLPFRHR
jgi:hypothetical protein